MQEEEALKKLEHWHVLRNRIESLAPTIKEEKELRQELIDYFFPTKVEGTVKKHIPHGNGWFIEYTHKIDRKVDEAVLSSVLEKLEDMKIPGLDSLFNFRPSLNLKEYRTFFKINKEACKILDTALIIKPAAGTLKITPPSSKNKRE